MKPPFKYIVRPCECGSETFRQADPVRCVECGNIPPSVDHRELPAGASVDIEVEKR